MSSEKSELRQLIRQQKRQFTQQQLGELSLSLCDALRQRLSAVSTTIIAYWPLPDEPDIRPLLQEWVGEGRVVLLPCVVNDTEMVLRQFTGVTDLREGAFHIMEPASLSSEQSEHSKQCAIIPGVAFDAAGHRLGRGRGYYDRFLAAHPSIYKIGVGYPFQLLERVPADVHDVLMDEIVVCP